MKHDAVFHVAADRPAIGFWRSRALLIVGLWLGFLVAVGFSTASARAEDSSALDSPSAASPAGAEGEAEVSAKESDPEHSVESGKQALGGWFSYPWYDQQTDDVRPIALRTRTPPSFEWLKYVAWFGLALLLVALAYALVMAYLSLENQQAKPATATAAPQLTAADRVEALPFLAKRAREDLLGEARRHYEQGNFAEAIIYLFSYELIELDKRQLIRLARGKTNRQYLKEIRAHLSLRRLLEQTMVTFEGVFFGNHPLDRANFEKCWNQLGDFARLLGEGAA